MHSSLYTRVGLVETYRENKQSCIQVRIPMCVLLRIVGFSGICATNALKEIYPGMSTLAHSNGRSFWRDGGETVDSVVDACVGGKGYGGGGDAFRGWNERVDCATSCFCTNRVVA